eukprot:PhM_4_TR11910/c0_g1_i1/m.80104
MSSRIGASPYPTTVEQLMSFCSLDGDDIILDEGEDDTTRRSASPSSTLQPRRSHPSRTSQNGSTSRARSVSAVSASATRPSPDTPTRHRMMPWAEWVPTVSSSSSSVSRRSGGHHNHNDQTTPTTTSPPHWSRTTYSELHGHKKYSLIYSKNSPNNGTATPPMLLKEKRSPSVMSSSRVNNKNNKCSQQRSVSASSYGSYATTATETTTPTFGRHNCARPGDDWGRGPATQPKTTVDYAYLDRLSKPREYQMSSKKKKTQGTTIRGRSPPLVHRPRGASPEPCPAPAPNAWAEVHACAALEAKTRHMYEMVRGAVDDGTLEEHIATDVVALLRDAQSMAVSAQQQSGRLNDGSFHFDEETGRNLSQVARRLLVQLS